jgi:L-ribulose-5-phosphate 3-epimerase
MHYTRRQFMGLTAAGVAASAFSQKSWSAATHQISACDWSIGMRCDLKAAEVAKACGLDGVEVSGGVAEEKDLRLADPAIRQQYKDAAAATGIAISSTALGLLNQAPLASDPRGPAWLEQIIDATADLGATNILLAFFGDGDLRDKKGKLKPKDVDAVVERLKAAAPRAEKAGVVLGLENTLSGKQNLDILDRVQSDAVRIYYDVYNSARNGYDVPKELRELGDLICQIHFKNGAHYLGEGKQDLAPVIAAIQAIKYQGWCVLETSTPSKDREGDFKNNANRLRKAFGVA